MRVYGYTRISTTKESQKTDRQVLALKEYADANNFEYYDIIEERISGTTKVESRSKYAALRALLREGDVLVITDIDRLGRSADDVIMEFRKLKMDGIKVITLDTPYLNDWNKVSDDSMYNMIADIFITLKAHMAQQEREKLVSRINQGLAAAKAKGTKLGRPALELDKTFIKQYEKFKSGGFGDMTASGFAKMMGIGRSTLYKYIDALENK